MSNLCLDNQLCFPLYVASKEIIRLYKPLLDKLDLTYTQYITMMVLWENKKMNVKELGKKLYLDSGTLTPLLKKLENKGYVTRTRLSSDERNVIISITKEGEAIKEKAASIPETISACVPLSQEETKTLYSLLYKVIENVK